MYGCAELAVVSWINKRQTVLGARSSNKKFHFSTDVSENEKTTTKTHDTTRRASWPGRVLLGRYLMANKKKHRGKGILRRSYAAERVAIFWLSIIQTNTLVFLRVFVFRPSQVVYVPPICCTSFCIPLFSFFKTSLESSVSF